MTDNNKMSRRDWFRLRPLRAEANELPIDRPQSTGQSMGEVPTSLQPIIHPENHGGIDLTELPPLREALLSEDDVRQLFSDIAGLATDIMLMQRSSRSPRATASITTSTEQLSTAQESLLSGVVPRVQIRYHWEAVNWIDTLERRDDGIRLIRITHLPTPAAQRR